MPREKTYEITLTEMCAVDILHDLVYEHILAHTDDEDIQGSYDEVKEMFFRTGYIERPDDDSTERE